MSDMVWSINPDNDSVDKMVARMKEFAAEILEPLNINYEFKEDPALRHTTVDLEKRKNLFLVFKEALNNAAKYSKSSFIRIELLLQTSTLHLVVTDNGIGFDVAKVKAGNGLRNMRERAKEVNATLTWQAGPASGTVVTLDLPVA
jgi:signal transduction histidine kinase